MTQYIIGAVSDLDVPMNPAAKGLYSLSAYMTGLDNATLQRERDELLAATEEDIRALSCTYPCIYAGGSALCRRHGF